jgi:hypothetical protein
MGGKATTSSNPRPKTPEPERRASNGGLPSPVSMPWRATSGIKGKEEAHNPASNNQSPPRARSSEQPLPDSAFLPPDLSAPSGNGNLAEKLPRNRWRRVIRRIMDIEQELKEIRSGGHLALTSFQHVVEEVVATHKEEGASSLPLNRLRRAVRVVLRIRACKRNLTRDRVLKTWRRLVMEVLELSTIRRTDSSALSSSHRARCDVLVLDSGGDGPYNDCPCQSFSPNENLVSLCTCGHLRMFHGPQSDRTTGRVHPSQWNFDQQISKRRSDTSREPTFEKPKHHDIWDRPEPPRVDANKALREPPLQRSSDGRMSSSEMTANDSQGGSGLLFITANKPADFRSKKNMTVVRKHAMAAFISDNAERRNHREKLKKRLEDLENRAAGENLADVTDVVDPDVLKYHSPDETVIIECVCKRSDDRRFVVPCVTCGKWQHITCYYDLAQGMDDTHECVKCKPRKLRDDGNHTLKRSAHEDLILDSNSSIGRSIKRPKTLGAESSIDFKEDVRTHQDPMGINTFPGSTYSATTALSIDPERIENKPDRYNALKQTIFPSRVASVGSPSAHTHASQSRDISGINYQTAHTFMAEDIVAYIKKLQRQVEEKDKLLEIKDKEINQLKIDATFPTMSLNQWWDIPEFEHIISDSRPSFRDSSTGLRMNETQSGIDLGPGILPPTPPRSKTGCLTCRKRKKKCDETKPSC